jgi:hypothetical protein
MLVKGQLTQIIQISLVALLVVQQLMQVIQTSLV